MQDSIEYKLRELGRWADYEDPNKWKDRDPIILDPSQTSWEQVKEVFGFKSDKARVIVGTGGKYGIQVIRLWRGSAEKLGEVVQSVAEAIGDGKQPWISQVTASEPATDQFLDEAFTSAEGGGMAMSDFYKDDDNAAMYSAALAYARKEGMPLYLGFFKTDKDYKGKAYLKRPGKFSYEQFRRYYNEVWLKDNSPIKTFDKITTNAERLEGY